MNQFLEAQGLAGRSPASIRVGCQGTEVSPLGRWGCPSGLWGWMSSAAFPCWAGPKLCGNVSACICDWVWEFMGCTGISQLWWGWTITLPFASWDLLPHLLLWRSSMIMEGRWGLWTRQDMAWDIPLTHSPCWDWDLGSTPTHAAVSGIPFPQCVCPQAHPCPLGTVFLVFFSLWCSAMHRWVCRGFCHLWNESDLRKYKSYNEYVLLEILKKPMSSSF